MKAKKLIKAMLQSPTVCKRTLEACGFIYEREEKNVVKTRLPVLSYSKNSDDRKSQQTIKAVLIKIYSR